MTVGFGATTYTHLSDSLGNKGKKFATIYTPLGYI